MSSYVRSFFAALLMITAGAQVYGEPKPTTQSREQATVIIEACVDADGKLLSAGIFESSGYPQLDEAALKVARANKYTAGTTESGEKKKRSCIKFKVKFVIKDGEPAASPAGAEAQKP